MSPTSYQLLHSAILGDKVKAAIKRCASFFMIFCQTKSTTFTGMELRSWLSYNLYPAEVPNAFLARGLRPFAERYVWSQRGTRAFFVRYEGEGKPYINLCLHGEPAWMERIPAVVSEWFSERAEVEAEPYHSSLEIFRSPGGAYWAEEHFHLSSRVVLERISRPYTYGDALFDALRLHIIALYAVGLTREQGANYFGRLCDRWAPVFIRPVATHNGTPEQWLEEMKEQFEKNFRPQQEEIRLSVVELWESLQKGRFDREQPEWLRWLRGNELILQQLGDALDFSFPTLIHLTNNRLGISNADEVYLAFVLSKAL